jgi:beta-lactamase regulating signal transducer with metallopeptidase domain
MNQLVGSVPALKVILDSPAVQRLSWVLLQYLWQGAAVGIVVGIALRCLRPEAARLRGAVACLGLVVLAALPPATYLRMTAIPDAVPATEYQGATARGPQDVISATARPAWRVTSARGIWPDLSRVIPFLHRIRPWALSLWLLGVVAGSVAWFGSWLALRRLCRGARPAAEEWMEASRVAARQVGLNRVVPILQSERVSALFVAGLLRPVILVPAASAGAPDAGDRTRVLAHEMAHLLRRDPWVNLLQSWTEILFFFQPAVWFSSGRLRVEREHCCDDLAVEACGDRLGYAKALAALEEARWTLPAFALGGGVYLKRRVARILHAPQCAVSHSGRKTAIAVLAALCLLITGAAIPPAPGGEQGDAHPQEVFARLIRAFADRDLELYTTCFTDDFVFERGEGSGNTWNLDAERTSTGNMFRAPSVVGVTMTILDDQAVTRRSGPNEWIVDRVSVDITVDYLKDGKVEQMKVGDDEPGLHCFTIRRIDGPQPEYRICHWLNIPESKADTLRTSPDR